LTGTDRTRGSRHIPREAERSGELSTRRFVTVVAVVLMLVALNLLAVIVVLDPFADTDRPDDDLPFEGHPWNATVEPLVISGEVEWTDIDARLEQPVIIESGGRLLLKDCHLQLNEEDVLWFESPYITVRDGGTLELDNSTLEVVTSELSDDVLVGPDWSSYHIPHMSRVVDLEGADRPVLTMDLRWRFKGTPLSISVQESTSSGLEELVRFDPKKAWDDWVHLEVPLTDYVDSIVRVIVYFPVYPRDVYYIRGLNITDDGDDLPVSIPSTEDAYYGQWMDSGFVKYWNALSWRWRQRRVILGNGEVSLRDSTISVPTEVQRSASSHYDRANIFTRWPQNNTWASTRDWSIELDHANLEATACTFQNVPVLLTNSRVELLRCTFVSPYDMVTLNRCEGEIVDGVFKREGMPDGFSHVNPPDRMLWALSIENGSYEDPVSVIDCSFQDVEEAIDLGQALYVIKGCTFSGVTRLAVWDHAPLGGTPWLQLAEDNTFLDCPGDLYMRTGLTDIYFNGTRVNLINMTIIDTEGRPIDGVSEMPGYNWDYWRGMRAHMLRLDVLVEALDDVRVVNRTEVNVYSYVDPYYWRDTEVTVTVDAGVYELEADLEALFYEQHSLPWFEVGTEVSVRRVWRTPETPEGTYNVSVVVPTNQLYVYNLTVDLFLNGHQVRHIEQDEFWDELPRIGGAVIDQSLYLDPGVNGLQVVVSGQRILNETHVNVTREEFADPVFKIMRAINGSPPEDVEDFLSEKGVVLAVDEGAAFELEDLRLVNTTFVVPTFYLTGGAGAALTFRNNTFEPHLLLIIAMFDHVDLHFVDTEIPSLYQTFYDYYYWDQDFIADDPEEIVGEITIRNCTKGWIHLNLYRTSLEVSDTSGPGGISLFAVDNATVSLHNVTDDDWNAYASGAIWSYTITDCHLSSTYGNGLELRADLINSIRVVDCVIDGSYIDISLQDPSKPPWDLEISGCEFTGSDSYLTVLWPIPRDSGWERSSASFPVPRGEISGNTFSGSGTRVVLHHALYGTTFGENTLSDDVRLWAWYWTIVEAHPEMPLANEYDVLFLDHPDLARDAPFPVEEETNAERYFYYDVTELWDRPFEPPRPTAVIVWYTIGSYQRMVTDFVAVDLTQDLNYYEYRIWSDPQGLLAFYIEDWPWDLEDYRGGRW